MYHGMDVKEVFKELGSSSNGLSDSEAKKRLEKYGLNQLKEEKLRSRWFIFLDQFKSFIVYILIAAVVISAILGEVTDVWLIIVILILNAIIGFVQENKAQNAIAALKKMTSLKTVVKRNGEKIIIDAKEVVPGDILLLETGEKIPADARLFEVDNLETQEATLTGESMPVCKIINKVDKKATLGDQKNIVFSGTIITKGRGKAIIVRTGMQSEIGKIASFIQKTEDEKTPMQKKLENFGKWLGIIIMGICAVVFLIGWLRGGEVMEMLLVAVSLAVAAIPVGLPAVITITLAIGVQKMIKKHALVRTLPSIESLGSVTVICTDKTGTLTKNEMTVTKVFNNNELISVTGTGYSPKGGFSRMPDELLLRAGALCNNSALEFQDKEWKIIGDPTEASLLTLARKGSLDENKLRKKSKKLFEIQFDSKRKMMTVIRQEGNKKIAYSKGALSVMLSKFSKIRIDGKERTITAKDKKLIMEQESKFMDQALRVLAVAYRDISKLKKYDENVVEKDLVFLGLVGMIDPPRSEVKDAIALCKQAGIKVVMITGDSKGTAAAIARELGITGKVVEGRDLENINLDEEVENIGIYARVNPEHKMQIVEAFTKKGEIVAMTGDGVNDAPALKRAHIGIAMGITGTDVAKEASDMILTDDKFTSIVGAVEEGRGIYNNTKKFINFMLSTNMGEILLLFFAMIIGFRNPEGTFVVPLLAVQILWLNLVTDGLPAVALGVDPVKKDIMMDKPRNPKEHIITKSMAGSIIWLGVLIAAACLYIFDYGLKFGDAHARTLVLTLLVMVEITQITLIRNKYHTRFFSNIWLWLAILLSIILQLAIIYTPINKLFKLVPLSMIDWAWIVGLVAGIYVLGWIGHRIIKVVTKQAD
ncbi:MAG: calcium-translocating P-type ATPase, SERCA-type [archaeon]